MQSLKNVPERIMWHDGMLLSPQHFQQAFKRCENIIRYQNFENAPYPFGIKIFKYEESSFASGILKIEELECTFQDGLGYYYNSNMEASPLQIDLTAHKEALSKQALTLTVCIPKNQNKNNILNSTFSRYKSASFDAYSFDENTGEDKIFIPRIKANICFLFEHEVTSNYIALPVAKIYLENSFYKTKIFAPPSTRVGKKSPIWNICNSICMLLRNKIQDIIEDFHKFDNETHRGIFYSRQLALRSMKANLPRLEACLHSGQFHPFQLYLEVYQVYGQIIANDVDESPQALIEYNHFNPLVCFEKIFKNIVEFLEKEIPTGFNITKLTKIDKKFQVSFQTELSTLENNTHILLGFKKNYSVSNENFLSWIKSAIICEEENYAITLERRSLGLSRSVVEKYDTLIPQRNIFLVYIKLENIQKEKTSIVVSASTDDNFHHLPDEIMLYSRKP